MGGRERSLEGRELSGLAALGGPVAPYWRIHPTHGDSQAGNQRTKYLISFASLSCPCWISPWLNPTGNQKLIHLILQRNSVIHRTKSQQVHFLPVFLENMWQTDTSVVHPLGMLSITNNRECTTVYLCTVMGRLEGGSH